MLSPSLLPRVISWDAESLEVLEVHGTWERMLVFSVGTLSYSVFLHALPSMMPSVPQLLSSSVSVIPEI